VRWQKKHVCGCEGMVVGTGNHTLAFVRWHFPFSFQSLCNKFSLVRSLLGLLVTVAICGGWDFEALPYQTVVILSKCTKAQIGYITQLTYIAC